MTQDSDNGNGLGGNAEENTGLGESRKRSLANLKQHGRRAGAVFRRRRQTKTQVESAAGVNTV